MTENERLTTECCGKYITFQGVTHNQCKQKLGEYESIGTIDEVKTLKEKNTPKELAEEYDNDVCEWKQHEREIDVYFTECGQAHIFVDGNPEENNYEYCPYCGKKIKIVGD